MNGMQQKRKIKTGRTDFFFKDSQAWPGLPWLDVESEPSLVLFVIVLLFVSKRTLLRGWMSGKDKDK